MPYGPRKRWQVGCNTARSEEQRQDANPTHVAASHKLDYGSETIAPWMRMFHVTDSDGYRIYFAFTVDAVHGNTWYGT